jgi:hypothetical protein
MGLDPRFLFSGDGGVAGCELFFRVWCRFLWIAGPCGLLALY